MMEESRKWQAKWIWLDKDAASGTKQERAYLRRTFRIADPGKARLTIDLTADSRYRLYMNGVWVSGGPPKETAGAIITKRWI
jgi:alpha-L-rhamnosidase